MTEEIRPLPLSPLYEVSSLGRVRRVGADRWKSAFPMKRGGYLAVNLWWDGCGHTMTVHKVVALTFLGPRPADKRDIAHIDGDKTNNSASNLRYATRAENEADKVRHGRSNRGSRNGHAKLTETDVLAIREAALEGGVDLDILAREYGVTKSCVYHAATGRHWGHV